MESIFYQAFTDHLLNNFQLESKKKIRYSEYVMLTSFLIEKGIFSKKKIRIYTVVNEYQYLFSKNELRNKTQIIKFISKKFKLHENTIWNIVGNHRDDFRCDTLPSE